MTSILLTFLLGSPACKKKEDSALMGRIEDRNNSIGQGWHQGSNKPSVKVCVGGPVETDKTPEGDERVFTKANLSSFSPISK